jgi:hypothetical protein
MTNTMSSENAPQRPSWKMYLFNMSKPKKINMLGAVSPVF